MMTRDRRRTAFTLIELLVVVSIIGVLVALTATAAFGVRRNMQKQNAEITLDKIDQKVQQKVKDIRNRIQDETKGPSQEFEAAKTLTGGNSEGAKAIMLYARLRQQLPMSVTEAKTSLTIGTGTTFTYQPSPAFNSLPNPGGATLEQSAACLYAAVKAMGPLDGLEQQTGTSQNSFTVFTDGFGTPISFIRIAYDGNAGELNNSPFTKNGAIDPFDPDNRATAALNNLALWNTLLGPTLSDAGTYNVNASPYRFTGTARNHTIAIFSAGVNKQPLEPPSNGIFDGDNLFSYRLRREGRGGE